MTAIQEKLVTTLTRAAERLRKAGLPEKLAVRMAGLSQQVHQPCVLAVVGGVKQGKSTFVNALLGADLAKVGENEVTATLNYFSYGRPLDPDRPVRCHWREGPPTSEDRADTVGQPSRLSSGGACIIGHSEVIAS